MVDTSDVYAGSLRVAPDEVPDPIVDLTADASAAEQSIVLAGGCFWCVEAVYDELDGVLSVRSGYAGGTAETADYRTVCSGQTNHAEVVEVRFDPTRISLGQILKVFFSVAHDPTTLNRQGNDFGRQYRSAIFAADADQRRIAEAYIDQLNTAGVFVAPIVTEVAPLEKFFEAESYHQGYAARNPYQPYIEAVSTPKVRKVRKYYADRLKGK
jgi:peptide-methionine (S)-S-oxide reductase